MDWQAIQQLLQPKIPPPALDYCLDLWRSLPFELKISKSRQTKVGDFTVKHSLAQPRITINHDLNPFLFLTTFIHEVAHHHTAHRFGLRVDPHGTEWKQVFKEMLDPLLTGNVYPPELHPVLAAHMQNPMASSFADVELTRAFRKFDAHVTTHTTVADLPEGSIFKLQGRFFKKGTLRRSRVLCYEMKTKKKYLVPSEALVGEAQLSLL
jgi:hypothetical protein